jgi:serine/threonine protein kinase
VLLHRKSLHPQDGLSFDDLEQKFSSLQAVDDSHLIKPVASCRILRNNHPLHGYFLLPRAEGGNLRDFWARQTTEPLSDQRLMKWVLNQTRGLCNALSIIYQRGECHGDIRPENILLFSEGGYKGTLRITFGGLPASDGQNRYIPPELVDGDHIPLHLIGTATLRNLIDIWCLGCVYVELLIWILYGADGLSVFDRSGAIYFWGRRNGEVIVHPLIQDWLNRLSRDLTGPTTALSDLLSVVKSDMLVPNLRSRINSTRVHERLVRISEKSSAEERYLLNPNTRRNIITRLSVLPLADMARASPPPAGTGNRRSG